MHDDDSFESSGTQQGGALGVEQGKHDVLDSETTHRDGRGRQIGEFGRTKAASSFAFAEIATTSCS